MLTGLVLIALLATLAWVLRLLTGLLVLAALLLATLANQDNRAIHPANARMIDEYRATVKQFRIDARKARLLEEWMMLEAEAERLDRLASEIESG